MAWFWGIILAFFHMMLLAEMLCWLLFCKSIPSSQLLETHHIPGACSLPEPLSFVATVILKISYHSAWGRWKMKRPPCGRFNCLRLTVGVFFPSKCFFSTRDVFKDCHVSWLIYSVDPQLPSCVDCGGFCSTVATEVFKFSRGEVKISQGSFFSPH